MQQMHNYFTSEFLASKFSVEHLKFIDKLAQAKSKTEEFGHVQVELESLSSKMSSPDVSSGRMKEYLIRLIHCHMLGYDVDFSVIYAIMATQSGETNVDRRIGYLACVSFLEKNHELSILLINTLLRDLKSQNHFAICAALNAVSYLEHEEMLDNVLDFVIQAVDFPKQIVRKRAVIALYTLYKDSGESAERLELALRKALTDKDMSVVFSALSVWRMLLKEHGASRFQGLLPVFYAIHRQIIDKRIHKSFIYHGVMAPWAQLDCLKIYSTYYELDIGSPQDLYSIIMDCLASVEKKFDMAFAIVLDCVKLLASIDPILLGTLSVPDENPFQILLPYLQATNHNMCYLGLTSLAVVDKSFWKKNWLDGTIIADIIRTSSDDDTILSQSLELLDSIMGEKVLRNISADLLDALSKTHGSKKNSSMLAYWLANRMTDYCNNQDAWFVSTLITILAESRKVLDEEYIESKCTLLKEILAAKIDSTDLREVAVRMAYSLLARTNSNVFSPSFVQLLFWVLEENGYLSSDITDIDLMRQLQKWVVLVEDEYLQIYGLQVIKKSIIRSNVWLADLNTILATSRKSTLPEKQAITAELLEILKDHSFEKLLQESSLPPQVSDYTRNPNRPTGVGKFLSDDKDTLQWKGTNAKQTDFYRQEAFVANEHVWDEQHLSTPNIFNRRALSPTEQPIYKFGFEKNAADAEGVNTSREQQGSSSALISSLLELELDDDNTALTTEQFGQLWLQYPCEQKKTFQCSVNHAKKLARRLQKMWDIYIVQILGEEFLAAENSNAVLVHIAMLSEKMFELTIRSEHSAEIARFLAERGLTE